MQKNPDIDIVGSFITEFIDDPKEIYATRCTPLKHRNIYNYSKHRNPLNHMTVMFKKDVVLKVGNYLSFIGFEDYYLWVRMLLNGAKFANIPENLVNARAGVNMLRKRKGWSYFKREIAFQSRMLKMRHISILQYLRNIIFRGAARLLPLFILNIIYKISRINQL